MSDQAHTGHAASENTEDSALDKIGPYLIWTFLVVVLIVSVVVMTAHDDPSFGRMGHTSTSESSAASAH